MRQKIKERERNKETLWQEQVSEIRSEENCRKEMVKTEEIILANK